jgi:hypothetical protein
MQVRAHNLLKQVIELSTMWTGGTPHICIRSQLLLHIDVSDTAMFDNKLEKPVREPIQYGSQQNTGLEPPREMGPRGRNGHEGK